MKNVLKVLHDLGNGSFEESLKQVASNLGDQISLSLKNDFELNQDLLEQLEFFFHNALRRIKKVSSDPSTFEFEYESELIDRSLAIATWLNSLA